MEPDDCGPRKDAGERAEEAEGTDRGALREGADGGRGPRHRALRRELAAAAAAAPRDPVVRTAAAVAAFSPARPLAPFPLLGPLTAAHPKAAVVRLHLGLLLLWTRQVKKGDAQLRLAIAEQPGSVYAATARQVLTALGNTRSK